MLKLYVTWWKVLGFGIKFIFLNGWLVIIGLNSLSLSQIIPLQVKTQTKQTHLTVNLAQ